MWQDDIWESVVKFIDQTNTSINVLDVVILIIAHNNVILK